MARWLAEEGQDLANRLGIVFVGNQVGADAGGPGLGLLGPIGGRPRASEGLRFRREARGLTAVPGAHRPWRGELPEDATMSDSTRVPTHTIGDYAYDAIYVGGIGGGLVALFFLVFDIAVHGEALFTPSLMGSVLFDGIRPDAVLTVNMIAVARYTAVHFVTL